MQSLKRCEQEGENRFNIKRVEVCFSPCIIFAEFCSKFVLVVLFVSSIRGYMYMCFVVLGSFSETYTCSYRRVYSQET